MDKKEFFKYLEDDSLHLQDGDNKAIAQLLKEVEDLDTPQPDQALWNQFNSRLQSRIDALPHRRFSSWFRAPALAILAAAVVLAFFLFRPNQEASPWVLDNFSHDELQVVSLIYQDTEFYDEDTPSENWSLELDDLGEKGMEILMESVESSAGMGPLYGLDPATFDTVEFQSLWKSEG